MKTWTEEELTTIYGSDGFISSYDKYCSTNKEQRDLLKFLDSIKLNEKYFRLTTNTKIGQNKRFRNKNISGDTLALKEVNSLLNKMTDKNLSNIIEKLKEKLKGKDYLKRMVIVNVLSKCVAQSSYNLYFIQALQEIYKDHKDLNGIIYKEVFQIEEKIKTQEISKDQSEYMQFCDKNKKLDLLIGHSLLVTELEKMKIIKDKIIPSLNNLIDIISETDNTDEKYKCVLCLYNIFKSYYGDNLLPQGFVDKIKGLIETQKSNKIKYKLMDINERR
jgi:hypothetical protein